MTTVPSTERSDRTATPDHLAGALSAARLASAAPTLVSVQNDNWLDVYAMQGTMRVRLAMVNGVSRAALRSPRSISLDGTVRLLADPVGSRDTTSRT